MILIVFYLCGTYVTHSNWYAKEALSRPSVIEAHGRVSDGTRFIEDDFREAYYWIKQNTDKKAKILSWWDYGYQISGMSNRTVLVDGNTNNNTHIATVGKALVSTEEKAHEIATGLDANYVLVLFGGAMQYGGDDVNKFWWFMKIASNAFPGEIDEGAYQKNGYIGID